MIRLMALVLVCATFAKPAYAYIDAALGGLVLQSILAGFFAFTIMWRGWIDKVKSFFRKDSSPEAGEAEQTTPRE